MKKEIDINNKVYTVLYTVYDNNEIYVERFFIKPEYQGHHRHYSKRIFERLMKRHNSPLLYLECFPSLIPFYKKCGFIKWSNSCNEWGGVEMHLPSKDNEFYY